MVVDAHHAPVTDGGVQCDCRRCPLEFHFAVGGAFESYVHLDVVSRAHNHPQPCVHFHQTRLFQLHFELHQLVVLERELLVVCYVVDKFKVDNLTGISGRRRTDFCHFLCLYACAKQAYKHTEQNFLHFLSISFYFLLLNS